jgi:hypothetical protein
MPNYDSPLWRDLDGRNENLYWGEIEHFHNFSRERLYGLLTEFGCSVKRFGVSERYRACMEVVAART